MNTEPKNWYSNDAATFGDRVSGAREALGLSQNELARNLGVKVKTVRNWENDTAEPRANKLQMLSGVLGVSLMWLLNGEGDGLEAPSDPTPLEKDAQVLLTELRAVKTDIELSAERVAKLEKHLRALLSKES